MRDSSKPLCSRTWTTLGQWVVADGEGEHCSEEIGRKREEG